MPRLIAPFTLAAILGLSPGCATLLASGPSNVEVRVEGPTEGAVVTLQGNDGSQPIRKDETHFRVTLDRYATYAVLVTADGYEPRLARLRSDGHPAYYFNLVPGIVGIAGSLLGSGSLSGPLFLGGFLATAALAVVDDVTKSGRRHETQTLVIPLQKREANPASPSGALR